ncbi:hypothetical protein OUZ56_008544 [Daphnia magna]|uniref:Sulfotransferase domain-containing protein n=1 Tax=Daphnia magna TaxID=35525 RepID=A0ABR0ADN5_9CRUS|nr:hypothetical protein OUZ56_008544 [Daphnia magna]
MWCIVWFLSSPLVLERTWSNRELHLLLQQMSPGNEKATSATTNIKFEVIPKTLISPFKEHFPGYTEGLTRGQPGGFVLAPEYAKHADELLNFQPRSDDVWIVTFPKCGTTWTQELVWMVMNECDEEAGKQPLTIRSPFLEFPYLTPAQSENGPLELNKMVPVKAIETMPSPRLIKTHLPLYLLHPKLLDTSKVVYVVRNPKDVIVSYFYHHRLIKFQNYSGTLEDFAQYFMDDEVFYAPFFPHALEAWAQRHNPNILFLFYEDMNHNLRGEIERVAAFLGKTLTGEQLARLVAHLRFETFAKNDAVNFEASKKMGFMIPEGRFIRKGQIGDWKNHFSAELNNRIDQWIEKNLAGTDLKFTTELE